MRLLMEVAHRPDGPATLLELTTPPGAVLAEVDEQLAAALGLATSPGAWFVGGRRLPRTAVLGVPPLIEGARLSPRAAAPDGLPHDFRTRVLGFSGCFLGVVVEVEDLLRGVVPQP